MKQDKNTFGIIQLIYLKSAVIIFTKRPANDLQSGLSNKILGILVAQEAGNVPDGMAKYEGTKELGMGGLFTK